MRVVDYIVASRVVGRILALFFQHVVSRIVRSAVDSNPSPNPVGTATMLSGPSAIA